MRWLSQHGSPVKRLFPVALVLAAFAYGPLTLQAQQSSTSPAAALPLPTPFEAGRFQPTPEQIGDSSLARRRYQEAIEAYKKVPKPSPGVWNKMGVSYQELLDFKTAMRCYRTSLRLNPGSAMVLNNLGSVYDSLGDHRQAEAMYRQALTFDPANANAVMNLGTNLMAQNKYREGREMYQRAAALDPDVFDGIDATLTMTDMYPQQAAAINYYKARSFAHAGKTNLAIKYLRRAIDEGFADPVALARDSGFATLRESRAFQRLLDEENEQKPFSSEGMNPELAREKDGKANDDHR